NPSRTFFLSSLFSSRSIFPFLFLAASSFLLPFYPLGLSSFLLPGYERNDQKSNYPEKGVTWWPRVLTAVKGSSARQVRRGRSG
ncbi:unnamed protein product, partial [Linum tenue]